MSTSFHSSTSASGGFGNMFSSGAMPPIEALLATGPLNPAIRKHVAGVYVHLASMMAVTVATILAESNGLMPRMHPLIIAGGLMISSAAFFLTNHTKQNLTLRHGLLYAFATFQGLLLAPMVQMLGYISPLIVPFATTCTAAIFLSFSIAAMYSSRRSMVFLAGILGSAISVLSIMSLVRIFVRSEALFQADLYLGLLMFVGYIMFDTQVMIYKATVMHGTDVERKHAQYTHAVDLYLDLINVFIRIAAIFADRQDRKGRRRDGHGSTRTR